ncbi:hypothetical protein FRC07_009672, partial [Ceratobasidium sp. 392]
MSCTSTPSTPLRRSPRRSVAPSPSPRRSPRRHQASEARNQKAQVEPKRQAAPRFPRQRAAPTKVRHAAAPAVPVAHQGFHIHYDQVIRKLDLTYLQSGPLLFRSIPDQFNPYTNPFINSGIWSFSPQSDIGQTSTLGRRIGDIHFCYRPGAPDGTFFVIVLDGANLRWIMAHRGFEHPLYP